MLELTLLSLNHDLGHCSSSFTLGSVSELTLLSLNHDLGALVKIRHAAVVAVDIADAAGWSPADF